MKVKGLSYIWYPPERLVEKSNVKKFMNKHGMHDYEDLIKRSTEDIEWFWDAATKELNVEWFEKYKKVLDASDVQWAN